MTRSQRNPSRRDQFNKAVRTKAQGEGITFKDAVTKTKAALKAKPEDTQHTGTERRNPGRNDGDQWKGHQFITSQQVGDRLHVENEDVYDDAYDFHAEADSVPRTTTTVDILDLARPAKRKARTNQFEFIPKARPVLSIATDDDDFDLISNVSSAWLDDDAWEDLYEAEPRPTTTYSQVLRDG